MTEKKKNLPRIQDVARIANVSTATVSRALSFPDRVSEKTRKAVFDAVEVTGYTINHAARNLRKGGTGAILVLVPNLGNAFFSRILKGIETVASEAGFNILIADSQFPAITEVQFQNYFNVNQADGLIVLDGSIPLDFFARQTGKRPPVIFACEWIPGSNMPAYHVDNVYGAIMATNHLIDLGHRHLGHVLGPKINVLSRDRKAGFIKALADHNIPLRSDWLFEGDFTLASGVETARKWLEMPRNDRPTALFCANDEMAFGIISELHSHGIEVPRDLSVMGFDDVELAAHYVPPLSTIHQPRREIGETAARVLIEAIRTPQEGPPSTENDFPLNVVVRGSTATPAD